MIGPKIIGTQPEMSLLVDGPLESLNLSMMAMSKSGGC